MIFVANSSALSMLSVDKIRWWRWCIHLHMLRLRNMKSLTLYTRICFMRPAKGTALPSSTITLKITLTGSKPLKPAESIILQRSKRLRLNTLVYKPLCRSMVCSLRISHLRCKHDDRLWQQSYEKTHFITCQRVLLLIYKYIKHWYMFEWSSGGIYCKDRWPSEYWSDYFTYRAVWSWV